MDNKTNIQHNKLMQLENSMLMYGVYNAETLENRTFYVHSLGLHHYSINSLLYLGTIQDKYIALYRELITQLCIYISN